MFPPLVVPLALGAAVSPALLTIVVLLLSGRIQPKPRAWAFTAGVALVAFAYIGVLATIGRNVQLGSSHPSTTGRIVHAVAAVLLACLGVRALWRREPTGPHPARARGRMADASPTVFFGIGAAAMATNFSSLLLIVPAVHEITRHVSGPEQLVPLAFVVVCAIAPAALPVFAVTLLGTRADAALAGLNHFTTEHARQINAGICFLFAVILGIAALE